MAFDQQIAALTTFCEASSASAFERRCVARTYFNRLALNPARYGRTVSAVCLKRFQYSEWNGDAADNANLERGASTPEIDPLMQDCLLAVSEAQVGSDPTRGATHYHDISIPDPYWTIGATLTLTTPRFRFFSGVR